MTTSPVSPPLAPGSIELWWSSIDLPPGALDALRADLDASTRTRIELLVRPDDRRRAVVAHGLLRRRVSELLGVPPTQVEVMRRCATCGATDHGKPEIVPVPGAPAPPAVNLAHSGSVAVVALSAAGPVGVDVEAERPNMDWVSHHSHVFSDAEWAATERAADPQAARLAAWTRKEAAAKATGHGVAVGLERVGIAEAPDDGGWHAVALPDGLGPAHVHDVELQAGHAAAVAVTGTGPTPCLTVRRRS